MIKMNILPKCEWSSRFVDCSLELLLSESDSKEARATTNPACAKYTSGNEQYIYHVGPLWSFW